MELDGVRLLPVALTLGLNNFAVSLALGALGQAERRWRIALAFTVFEFSVPLLGMTLGRALSVALAESAGWIGGGLLGLMGAWTLVGALRRRDDERLTRSVASWGGLVVLAAGLSLDNLIVGLGLGLRGFPPLAAALVIATSVLLVILLGLRLGSAARRHWERRSQAAAGVLLLGLGGAMAAGWI